MAFVNNQKPCLHSTYIVHEFVNLMVQLSVNWLSNLLTCHTDCVNELKIE